MRGFRSEKPSCLQNGLFRNQLSKVLPIDANTTEEYLKLFYIVTLYNLSYSMFTQ